ncbi:hypothetical protein JMJ56_28570 [Belnapia sp. T18]|uniref:Peptidase S8/S53 domain-containing protein n=1 Tax=Belnapia arida TaxID=2804533 RepID=A0ABS1UB74_9PROT|nr:hypothetical protein [Belnapia arida]MBL6081942.1 hypothetical protein [Belnapia arida]
MNLYHYSTMHNVACMFAALKEAHPGMSWTQIRSMAGDAFDGAMMPSLVRGKDAHHGSGYYFTSIMPGTLTRAQIAKRLWRDTRKIPWTEAFIEFRMERDRLLPAGPDCWVYPLQPNDINPRITPVYYGLTEDP